MGNGAEEDLATYSNFEDRVRSRTSFLFFPSTRVCRSVSKLKDRNEPGACQYLYLV